MNSNEIKNNKVEVPSGKALNDKDYADTLLSCLKGMVKNYAVSLTEASNEYLYREYKKMFDGYSNLQREVFEMMFRKGWYVLEKAEDNKVSKKITTLNQELTDLNS